MFQGCATFNIHLFLRNLQGLTAEDLAVTDIMKKALKTSLVKDVISGNQVINICKINALDWVII